MTMMLSSDAQTDGNRVHTGRFKVSCKLDNGTLVTLVLPDDWQTLLARVTALEGAVGAVNSLEDLTYGG